MAKKIDISIPTPCQESWAEMQANDLGRFCFSCQKTVIDFTEKTDREIAEILLQSKGKVCGRFQANQLKTIYLPAPQLNKNHFKTYFFALSNAILASLFVPTQVKAQVETVAKNEAKDYSVSCDNTQHTEKSIFHVLSHEKPNYVETLVIMGKVRDKENNMDLPGANVILKGTSIGVVTDAEGNFQIEINPENKFYEEVITFSFVGFVSQEVKIAKTKNNNSQTNIILLEIDLEEEKYLLTAKEVIMVGAIDCNYANTSLYKIVYQKLRNWLRF